MVVVSNTSPLLNLEIIGHLDLLRQQFGQVLIPRAVLDELKIETNFPGAQEIGQALSSGWVIRQEVADINLVRVLKHDLDDGESEAIALAIQQNADILLMDEHDGRAMAKDMGVSVIGVLGILLRGKQNGQVASVRAAIRALRQNAGFRVSNHLVQQILAEAGE